MTLFKLVLQLFVFMLDSAGHRAKFFDLGLRLLKLGLHFVLEFPRSLLKLVKLFLDGLGLGLEVGHPRLPEGDLLLGRGELRAAARHLDEVLSAKRKRGHN